METIVTVPDDNTKGYVGRCEERLKTFAKATTTLIQTYILGGDTLEQAQDKVKQISSRIRELSPGAKYDYILGDRQNLLDTINAIDDLPFFTQNEKDLATGVLSA